MDARYFDLPSEKITRLCESRLDRFDFKNPMPHGFLQQLCRLACLSTSPPYDEEVAVDAEGGLRDALTYQLRREQDKEIMYLKPILVQSWLKYNPPDDAPNSHHARFCAELVK